MPTYIFYPRRPDTSCLTFTVGDLADDAHALRHAETVLLAHASAVEVTAYDGERIVGLVSARHDAGALAGDRLGDCSVLVIADPHSEADDLRKPLVRADARAPLKAAGEHEPA